MSSLWLYYTGAHRATHVQQNHAKQTQSLFTFGHTLILI